MQRRRTINHWGYRYRDTGAPIRLAEPVARGFGLYDWQVAAVQEWQKRREQFVKRTIAAILIVAAICLVCICGWLPGFGLLGAFGFLVAAICAALIASLYGKHPDEAAVAEYQRARYAWERLGRPLAAHMQAVKPWTQLTGAGFERAITRLLRDQGFEARKTPNSGDGGVDIEVFKDGMLFMVVQCKRYKDACGPAVARELYGAMTHRKAPRAILVCLGGFTRGVETFVAGKSIMLLDSKKLIDVQEGKVSLQDERLWLAGW